MNLEDVIDPETVNSVHALQQDEWSLSKPTFGEEGQITVVGWSGKQRTNKYYILKCSKCSQDSELFGEGYFRSPKSSLVRGQIPCGCSKSYKWSEGQYTVRCSRKAKELGYTFLGFAGDWVGYRTKIRMLCKKHGEWCTGIVRSLLDNGNGCPACKAEITSDVHREPSDIAIQSFLKTGAFHPETGFRRSERENTQGAKVYWLVSCPGCGQTKEAVGTRLKSGWNPCGCAKELRSTRLRSSRTDSAISRFFLTGAFPADTVFERDQVVGRWTVYCPVCKTHNGSDEGNLKRGRLPCCCSIHRQQEAYINYLLEGEDIVAIKFGIARDSKQRVKQQDSKSVYTLKKHSVYKFPDVASCKQAERECKKELETGVVLKRDMPDGWTETTWSYNIGKVVDIYKRNGGVLV